MIKYLNVSIHNEVYPYHIDNNLISSHQLGFKGGDSCIKIQSYIKYINTLMKILKSVEYSKAFDGNWHDGLVAKRQKKAFMVNYHWF